MYVKMFKAGLEILAILVAGTWAWFVFREDTAPSLEKLAEFGSTLDWSNYTTTSCDMEYTVSFKNLSKHRVKVAKSRVRAWYMTKPETPAEATPVVYLAPLESLDGDAIFDSDKDKHPNFNRLTGNYGPAEGDTEGFTFFVKQAPGKRILLLTELWSDDDITKKKETPTWVDNRHDWMCRPAEAAK
jgi:hypothetical protein